MSRGGNQDGPRAGYGLTARARELLAYLSNRETCPSFDEMAAALGLSSKASIYRLLGQLEERGFIVRYPGRARAIEVLYRTQAGTVVPPPPVAATYPEVLYLPLHGRID